MIILLSDHDGHILEMLNNGQTNNNDASSSFNEWQCFADEKISLVKYLHTKKRILVKWILSCSI